MSEDDPMTVTTTLEKIKQGCPECGVLFAIPKNLLEAKRRTGLGFHCPNGHFLSFKESDSTRLGDALKLLGQLREFVKKAGHLTTCDITPSQPCSCGFDKLAAIKDP